MKPMPHTHQPPAQWVAMARLLFEIDKREFAQALWQALYPRPELTYALSRLEDTRCNPEALAHLQRLLTPRDLMFASELLVERRGIRSRAVIDFQERLLELTNRDGGWL